MKKSLIILGAILSLLVILILLAPIWINTYLNKNADQIFREMILKANGFLEHEVNFKGISLSYHLKGSSLKIDKIAIHPKESLSTHYPKIVLSAEDLEISGLNWSSYFLDSSIEIQKASIQLLNVISFTPELFKESLEKENKKSSYRKIKVDELSLKTLNFQNKSTENDSLRLRITNASLNVIDLSLLPRHLQNPFALFQAKEIEANVEEVRIALDKYYQKLILHDIYFDSKHSNFEMVKVQLDQTLNRQSFNQAFSYRKDYLSLSSDRVSGTGVDWLNFFDHGNWHIEKIKIQNPILNVFVNKQKPKNSTSKKLLFAEQIKTIKIPLQIDSLVFQNAQVYFEEIPEKDFYKNGKLNFTNLEISILNLTNQKQKLKEKSELLINAKGSFMNSGNISLNVQQDLLKENGQFKIQGHLGKMPLQNINEILEPETQVSIHSGNLIDLSFQMIGNNHSGEGELIVQYEDLLVKLLDKKEPKSSNFWKQIASFIANTFVIKSNNPNKRGQLIKGKIDYQRTKENSNINYWWQLILSGIKSTFENVSEEVEKSPVNPSQIDI